MSARVLILNISVKRADLTRDGRGPWRLESVKHERER